MTHPNNGLSGQVRIADKSLSRIEGVDGVWRFSITMGGFIVNGFTYSEKKRQIRMPTCNYGSGPRKLVRAFGIHVKRLRDRIEQEIEESHES